MNRHELQIAAYFYSRDGSPGEIVERQNSYGRITEQRPGKAYFEGGSEVPYAESPVRIQCGKTDSQGSKIRQQRC